MSLQDAKDRVKAELEERLKAPAGAARVYDDPKDARAEAAYIANGRLARQAAADHGAPTLLVQSDNNDLSVVEATTLDRAVFHAEVESELLLLSACCYRMLTMFRSRRNGRPGGAPRLWSTRFSL